MGLEHWDLRFNRRKILSIAAGAAGALALTDSGHPAFAAAQRAGSTTPLPVADMEKILGATGTVDDEVLQVQIDRSDLTSTLPGNIPASSQLVGQLYFQPAHNNAAILNGDFCLTSDETNPFIDALMSNGLVVQAFHQHLYDLIPAVWFVHFRGHMEPLKLGHAIRKAMNVTAVKLPQTTPPKPTTPFDVKKLEIDLRGDAQFRPDRRFVDEDILLARNVNGNDAARPDIGLASDDRLQLLDIERCRRLRRRGPGFSSASLRSDSRGLVRAFPRPYGASQAWARHP
jgi:hypothetical protein